MENIQTKVPDSRRGKYVVIGLLAVICLLSFHVYREHKLKKDLVRRKAFLLGKLRDSRMSESKTTTKLERVTQGFEEKKQQLTAKGKEIEDWKNKLEEMTNSYNKGLQEVVSLKESATKSQDSLATLKKQYLNATSTIDIMKATGGQTGQNAPIEHDYHDVSVGFAEGGKPENPVKNPRSTGEINYNSTHISFKLNNGVIPKRSPIQVLTPSNRA